MRRLVALMVALALSTGMPAMSAEGSRFSKETAETPGDALKKANPDDREPRFLNFSGGIFQVRRPEDDIREPLPADTREGFERAGYELVYDDRIEYVVDRAGQIYEDRHYGGVIPGIRDAIDPADFEKKRTRPWVLWVGYQPMAAFSRIFWLLSEDAPRFQVKRVSPTRLDVFFPRARVPNYNTIRELFMDPFTGPVRSVMGARHKGGIRYVVTLKNPAHYLYRYEAPYLFLDLEVDAEM